MSNTTRYASVLFSVLVVAIAGAGPLCADDARDKELVEVRGRIEKLRKEVSRQVSTRDKLTARLRDTEVLMGDLRRNLVRIRAERANSEARHKSLLEQADERRDRLNQEHAGLASQLRTAYVNGRQEQLKLLLSQEDPASLGRLMVFYRYFNESRLARIASVEEHLEKLAAIAAQTRAETSRLATLEAERSRELASLEKARTERTQVVSALNARIANSSEEIGQLEAQEKSLARLIRELQETLAQFPVASQETFQSLKGKLAWPVQGVLLAKFGQARAGPRLKWNGVLIGADQGKPVRAIAHGRVAFADWLPGLGLIVILEHGAGYLSLYGHNGTLTCVPGDWVDAGDVVATVGESGGQARPALYFEVRRNKTPMNPQPWFRKRL